MVWRASFCVFFFGFVSVLAEILRHLRHNRPLCPPCPPPYRPPRRLRRSRPLHLHRRLRCTRLHGLGSLLLRRYIYRGNDNTLFLGSRLVFCLIRNVNLESRKTGTQNRRRKGHDAVHPGRSPRRLSQVRSDG